MWFTHLDLSQLLTKTYIKYGLTVDEYLVLNAYCMHSGFYKGIIDFEELAEMTGKTSDEVVEIIKSLLEKKKIEVIGRGFDREKLYRALSRILEDEKSLVEKINDSKQGYYEMGGYGEFHHYGQIELEPFYFDDGSEAGISIIASNGYMWKKERMIELANEILKFASDLDEKFITDYNTKLKKKNDLEHERAEERRKELEEIRNQPYVPKSGYIFLIQFPNGTHKFTYTTSLTKEGKVERIKLENGDTVQILHVLEAYDTMQLLHQFLKKQFSNRAINSNHSTFKLMDEDIEYIRNEVYPSNAMEWLNGSTANN